jgi:hypothetical protein
MSVDELKLSIIDLYQNVKIRKKSDEKLLDNLFLEREKESLLPIAPKVLIEYIKIHLNLLIDLKVNEKLSKLEKNPMEFISYYGTDIPENDYEKLLRRYEGDIRNYIRMVNILKIHIEELNQKIELLQNQIEQFQKESVNYIPTNKSLEYKKKIEELTTLIKSYEKHNLKIPLLEKKIKKQKIDLDKLDSFYKKQIKSFTKKIEKYEKGVYLNKNNSLIKKVKVSKSNYNSSLSKNNKARSRMNSISPPKGNKTLSCYGYDDSKIAQNLQHFKKIKKANSIKTIFLYSKNNDINKINRKIDEDIKTNLNINNININGGKAYKYFQNNKNNNVSNSNNNINSPKKNDKKPIDSYYDSIETEEVDKKMHKTINASETTSVNFRKKSYMKPNNNIKKVLYINNNKDNTNSNNNIITKLKTRSNSKKIVKKISSNKSILKIPKNIPDHINTSKYISIKGKNIPNLNRYNSLKQLITDKNRIKMSTNKENEQLNKTFSRITNTDNLSSNTRSSTNNDNRNQKIIVKNFVISKATPTIINGKNPIPIKKVKSKMQ